MRRFVALALGCLVAAGVLAGFERRQRALEIEHVDVVPELKYAGRPGMVGPGWREDVTPRPRTPGTRRVIFVGDSVTYGVGVQPSEAWPFVVRDALDRATTEVFDFALPGWDVAQAAALIDTRLAAWTPDLVVWGAYANDVFPTRTVVAGREGGLVYVDTEVPKGTRLVPELLSGPLLRHSALFRKAQGAWYVRRVHDVQEKEEPTAWFARHMRRGAAGAEREGFPLLIVAIPPHVLATPCAEPALCENSARIYPQFLAGLRASGVPWLDAMEAWRGEGPFPLDGPLDADHPNAEGHRLLAEWAAPHVAERLPAAAAGAVLAPDPEEAGRMRRKGLGRSRAGRARRRQAADGAPAGP